jgi:uncharacterized membrane protein
MAAEAAVAPPTKGETRLDWYAVAVGAASVLFTVVFSFRMVNEYRRFGLNAFDIGIFDQGLWLLSRFADPFITVRGLHLFADHSSYIMVPLAPLYWVAPHTEALLVFTAVLLAIGAPLAYYAARALGAPGLLAGLVGIGYLASPAVQWNVRDTFHPEQFVLPLLIGAFLLLARDRDRWAILLVIVALLAKEDVGLIVVPFGLFVWWWFERPRQGLIVAGLGIAALIVNFEILLPYFSPTGELLYSWRYARLGEGFLGIATGLVIHPGVVFEALTDPLRLGYLALVLLPLPLALLEPRALLMSAPAALANLVSTHPYQYQIQYHYSIYLLVGVVIAATIGAAKAGSWENDRLRNGAVAASVVAALAFVPASPLVSYWSHAHSGHDAAREAIALIPDDAAVSAFNLYVPHLARRTTVFEFPNPWQRLNYSVPGLPAPDAASVEWVLARDGQFQDVTDRLLASGEWVVVYDRDPVLLLRRAAP